MSEFSERYDDAARKLTYLFESIEDGIEVTDPEGTIYAELCEFGERYIEKETIAKGGMKEICRVFDRKTCRYVAMAELHSNAPRELFEPFLREARLTALLEHPNIITVHDIGLLPEGMPYFTMDLKRGDSLAAVIKKSRLSRNRLLEVFVKLCDAVAYAHSQKVLHLDLKPENIQIGRFGEVFICDWGLGKIEVGDECEGVEFDEILFNPDLLNNMTLAGQLKGTPGYMAPEQVETNGTKTTRTDVYALGCILYAVLTGKPPLSGMADEVLEKTMEGKIVPPAKAFPRKMIPQGLNAVVMKALALKPSNRYASVTLLRDDVENYLSGFSTSAEKAGFIKEGALFYKRNRNSCHVGLLSGLVLVMATGWFIRGQQKSIVETRLARELADERRIEAERVSEKYREELTRNMRLMGSLSGDLKREAFELSRTLIYSDPVRALQLAQQRLLFLARRDPSQDVYSELGYVHFIMQHFEEASEYLGSEDARHPDLLTISAAYRNAGDDELLSIDQFVELIGQLRDRGAWRKPLMEKMLVYDHELRRNHVGYEKVIEAVLRGWNPRWTAGQFDYDPQKALLQVRGARLRSWAMITEDTSGVSPLRFLNIKVLDARDSGLTDLAQIKKLPVELLDIRGTRVEDLSPLMQFPALKTLIVEKGQFPEEMIDRLPKTIKIRSLP